LQVPIRSWGWVNFFLPSPLTIGLSLFVSTITIYLFVGLKDYMKFVPFPFSIVLTKVPKLLIKFL
jgi:hypothetical protein